MQLSQGFPCEVACLRASLINGGEGTFPLVSADIARCRLSWFAGPHGVLPSGQDQTKETVTILSSFPWLQLPRQRATLPPAHQTFPLVLTLLLGSSSGPGLTICIPSCSSRFGARRRGDPSRG